MSAEPIRERLGLALLLYLHIVVCCASLVCVAAIYPEFHIFFQPAGLFGAVSVIALFSVAAVLFIFAEFSFGYFVAFYFYMMVVGYLWLNYFSDSFYNHRLSALSAAASALAFMVPALFITSPLRQIWSPLAEEFQSFAQSPARCRRRDRRGRRLLQFQIDGHRQTSITFETS